MPHPARTRFGLETESATQRILRVRAVEILEKVQVPVAVGVDGAIDRLPRAKVEDFPRVFDAVVVSIAVRITQDQGFRGAVILETSAQPEPVRRGDGSPGPQGRHALPGVRQITGSPLGGGPFVLAGDRERHA